MVEEVLHPVRVAEGQMALEEQAVETRQRAGRGRGMLGEELPHGVLRLVAMNRSEDATNGSELPSPSPLRGLTAAAGGTLVGRGFGALW